MSQFFAIFSAFSAIFMLLSAKALCFRAVRSPRLSILSSGQILLPWYPMNSLSNLDETRVEYSLAHPDNMIRSCRSKVTAGYQDGEALHVNTGRSLSFHIMFTTLPDCKNLYHLPPKVFLLVQVVKDRTEGNFNTWKVAVETGVWAWNCNHLDLLLCASCWSQAMNRHWICCWVSWRSAGQSVRLCSRILHREVLHCAVANIVTSLIQTYNPTLCGLCLL